MNDSSCMTAEENNPNALDEFRQEFGKCWRELPDKTLFFSLLAGWLALFQLLGNSTLGYVDSGSLFTWLGFIYRTSADDEHGALIPVVVMVLFWWKRRELGNVPKANWWPALGLVLVALALHVVAFTVQQPKFSVIAFFTGLYGLTGLVWGRRWLAATFFPFFLFSFCLPLGDWAENITFPLRLLVTRVSVAISHGALGIDVLREGSQIFDSQRTFQYDVAPACSGIRSLVALLALTTIYGFVSFQSTWKRLLMVAIAVPLAVVGNVVRITGVILTAEAFGQNAGARLHDWAGFVTFAVAIGCVLALGYWLREDRQPLPGAGRAT